MSAKGLLKKYSDIPRSVVLKTELYRQGYGMTQTARDAVKQLDLNFKGEFMFSWDFKTGRKCLAEKVPFIMHFKRDNTLLVFRSNELSPYKVDLTDGRFFLCEEGEPFEEVWFQAASAYQHKKTSDGVSMGAVAQAFGDYLYVCAIKYCEFWKEGLQCKYCDINATTADQAKRAREEELAVVHRTPEQIAETLEMAFSEAWPTAYRHAQISGGTIVTTYHGMSEVDYYVDVFTKIYKRLRRWHPVALQAVPPDEDGWKRYLDAGVVMFSPNIEVWDPTLFKILCPGKEKYIGRDEWIRRSIKGAKVFPPWSLQPLFVLGVEMAKPWGFTDVDSAVKSTIGGFEYLYEHGLLPRTILWLPMQGSALGNQEPAPLEFYMEFGRRYKELRDKYGQYDMFTPCRRCANPSSLEHDWDYVTGSWG